MYGHAMPWQHRLRVMQTVVGAVVRHSRPLAAYCNTAQKWSRPEDAASRDAFINVRMFDAAGDEPGEAVMDSLGLHAFDLPDVEALISDTDPGAVAGSLYDIANRILKEGDHIADGDTVGPTASGHWRCRRATSRIAPQRPVLRLTTAG